MKTGCGTPLSAVSGSSACVSSAGEGGRFGGRGGTKRCSPFVAAAFGWFWPAPPTPGRPVLATVVGVTVLVAMTRMRSPTTRPNRRHAVAQR